MPKKIQVYIKCGNLIKTYTTSDQKEIAQVINIKSKLRPETIKFKVLQK